MFAKLRALWASDTTPVIIGALTVGLGLKTLQNVYDKRTEQVTSVTEELAARRAELRELTQQHQKFVTAADEERARWRADLDARIRAEQRADAGEVNR